MALYLLTVLSQKCIRSSAKIGAVAGIVSAAFKFTDRRWDYLKMVTPNNEAFGLFASTMSFLLVLRTVRAVNRYFHSASAAYHMTGAWFDACSTLFAFCRCATAPIYRVREFKIMIVRLFSLLSMLCLEELENCEDVGKSQASNFIVIDAAGIDPEMLQVIKDSKCRAEVVLQMIQCLIVDNLSNGVLAVPPPILTRALQDLGNGMLKFHETLHISRVSVPFPLKAVTQCLLVCFTVWSPMTIATWTRGAVGAFALTFVQVSVFSTLHQLAVEIENPFGDRFKELRMGDIHHQMNLRLASLHSFPTTFLSQRRCDSRVIDIINSPSVWQPLSLTPNSFEEMTRLQELGSVIRSSVVHDTFSQTSTMSATASSITKNSELGILSIPMGFQHCHGDRDRDQECAVPDASRMPILTENPMSPSWDDGAVVDPATGPTHAAGAEDNGCDNHDGVTPPNAKYPTRNGNDQDKCNTSTLSYDPVTSNANTHGDVLGKGNVSAHCHVTRL